MVNATTLIMFGLFCGTMGFILVRMLWNMMINARWPISVSIGMQRGESIVWDDSEKARLIKAKDGYQVLRLRKKKQSIKPRQYKHLGLTNRGKPRLQLFEVTSGQYYSIETILPEFKNRKITKEDMEDPIVMKKIIDALKGKTIPIEMTVFPKLEIVEDASTKNWGILQLDRLMKTYSPKDSWFNKYATFIMSAILAATMIFSVMFFGMKMESISQNFAGASVAMRDAAYISRGLTPPGQVTPTNNTAPPNSGVNILGMTIP